jgi:DNA-directed RNA polymerase specialized sigma24 family protein
MAFRELVKRHNRAMKRIALTFVRSASVADEVVQETWLALVAAAIEQLPERQEQVIGLRNVEGCEAEDVCESLELSPANQRLLLHRADPQGLARYPPRSCGVSCRVRGAGVRRSCVRLWGLG